MEFRQNLLERRLDISGGDSITDSEVALVKVHEENI
jgi:hypothetical protein